MHLYSYCPLESEEVMKNTIREEISLKEYKSLWSGRTDS